MQGNISNNSTPILIDSGSTHNFIQTKLALVFGWPITTFNLFKLLVDTDVMLQCSDLCPQLQISTQSHTFFVDLYLLPIQGFDVVLGMQWILEHE